MKQIDEDKIFIEFLKTKKTSNEKSNIISKIKFKKLYKKFYDMIAKTLNESKLDENIIEIEILIKKLLSNPYLLNTDKFIQSCKKHKCYYSLFYLLNILSDKQKQETINYLLSNANSNDLYNMYDFVDENTKKKIAKKFIERSDASHMSMLSIKENEENNKLFEQEILKINSPRYIYFFAKNSPYKNIKKLSDGIIKTKNVNYMIKFLNLPEVNKRVLEIEILKIANAIKINELAKQTNCHNYTFLKNAIVLTNDVKEINNFFSLCLYYINSEFQSYKNKPEEIIECLEDYIDYEKEDYQEIYVYNLLLHKEPQYIVNYICENESLKDLILKCMEFLNNICAKKQNKNNIESINWLIKISQINEILDNTLKANNVNLKLKSKKTSNNEYYWEESIDFFQNSFILNQKIRKQKLK